MNEKARLIIDANEMIPLLIEAADKAADIKEYAISGAFMFVVNQLDNAPTIDHDSLRPHGKWEPVLHGRWICKYDPIDGSTDIMCSHCKDTRNIEGCYEGTNEESLWDMENYCPNCGTKMEE